MAAAASGREDARRPLVDGRGGELPGERLEPAGPDEGPAAAAAAAPEVHPSSFRALFRFATGSEVCLLLGAGVLACIGGCAGPAMSFFMKDIVEVIFAPADERHEKVRPVFLRFVGIAVGSWLTITLSCLAFGRVSDRMSVRMREAFFSHLLQKDVGWYDSNSSAEMTTRLTQDSHDFREGCGIKLALFLLSLVQVPLGVAVAFVRDWRFASILIGVVPLIGTVLGVSMKMALRRLTMQAELYTKAGGIAETALGSIQTVAAFGGYSREIARYDGKLREAERDGIRAGQSEALASSVTAVTFNAVFAIGLEVGSIFMLQSYDNECWDARTGSVEGCFNGSVMLSCLFAVLTGGFAMAPAFQQLGVLNRSRVAASRMYAIIDDPPAFDAGCGSTLETLRGEVEFQGVHFAYPTRPETAALNAVSFKVPAGSTAAFVGPSGSGKSTSIALLMRYYDAASGDVLLDGRDIRSLNLGWVRLQMALVQQEPVLFTGTILSNILHGRAEASREDAVRAARVANADGFVSALEKGYETAVGERGATLSGGQKQRIAIARAMIRDPKVLLLDEATSALDTESERVVMEALDAIVAEGHRTTLVIAHRLSTVKNSDVIFVLEDGSLVERGTHAELLATEGGLYQQLVQLQNLSGDGEQEPPLEQLTRQLSRQTSRRQSESALSRQSSELSLQHSGLSRQESSPLGRLGSALSRERSSRELRRTVSGSLARAASEFAPTSQAAHVEERGGGAEDTSRDAVPGEDEQDKEVPSSRLLGLLSTGWLAVAMVMTGFQSCCGPLMGRLFGHSIDVLSAPPALPLGPGGSWVPAYSAAKVHDAVRETCVLYGAVSAVQLVSIYLAGSGFRRVSEGLTRRVRIETFSAIMRQEMAYFDLRTCGQLTDRLAHEAAMIKSFTGESFGGVVRVLVTIVVAMCLALLESWQLTATLILIMPFMMVGQIFKMRSLKKKDESRAGPVVSEVVGNIKTVAAFSLQDRMLKWYKDVLRKEFMEDKRQCTVTAIMEGYNSFVTYMLYGSVMLVASCYIDFFHLDPQSVLQVFFTLVFSLGGISQGITQWQGDKAKGAHALKRIFNTLDRTPRIDAYDEGGLRLEKVEGAIGFSHVHFSYPSQPHVKVFVDFDLAIEAGKRVAFVGPSGSGKSTTIRLLQRFYDPAAGCVTFDGHDIRSLNLQWLRSVMSLVQQEPVLFAGSVLDNIKYGREGATDDDAIAAAKDANAHDFITKFEDQYQTSVGERGAQLSGGQKQRVAIARCMVRRPRVLLLDEATSALDTESERVVQEALDALLDKEQRTTLVIAHRLSTVQSCDAICVVYQGRVVEKGTHQELMRIPGGQYKQLAARQQL